MQSAEKQIIVNFAKFLRNIVQYMVITRCGFSMAHVGLDGANGQWTFPVLTEHIHNSVHLLGVPSLGACPVGLHVHHLTGSHPCLLIHIIQQSLLDLARGEGDPLFLVSVGVGLCVDYSAVDPFSIWLHL